MSNIISLMTDTESYTEWLHFCVEATILSKISDSEGIVLFVYDTDSFWYKNRFLIAKAVVLQEESLDRLEYRLSEPDDGQIIEEHKPKGAVKIKSFDISWIFTRIDKDNILAEYKMNIDAGIPFGVSGYLKKMGHNTLIKFGRMVNTLKL
jgi:hypothetical protein